MELTPDISISIPQIAQLARVVEPECAAPSDKMTWPKVLAEVLRREFGDPHDDFCLALIQADTSSQALALLKDRLIPKRRAEGKPTTRLEYTTISGTLPLHPKRFLKGLRMNDVEGDLAEATAPAETVKKLRKKAEKNAADKAPRASKPSMYAGKVFRASTEVLEKGNPRREGTAGWTAMAAVIAAGVEGISYEDYLARGGRQDHLKWDLGHGSVIEKA